MSGKGLKTLVIGYMTDSSSSAPASPSGSTPPSSLPSPEVRALSLQDVSPEHKEQAAKLKVEANEAFKSTQPFSV